MRAHHMVQLSTYFYDLVLYIVSCAVDLVLYSTILPSGQEYPCVQGQGRSYGIAPGASEEAGERVDGITMYVGKGEACLLL